MRLSLVAFPVLFAGFLITVSCGEKPIPQFNENSAWDFLIKQCAFGPRVPGSRAHAEVVSMIRRELTKSGWEVELQEFTISDPYNEGELELVNVMAELRKKETKRILLAAHFDTRPRADNEKVDSLKSLPIPGANDGASGVAVLLELGRVLGADPPKNLGVDLVFFDGEDYGKLSDIKHYLLGSKHYSAGLSSSLLGYHPVCGVLLDMVGAKEARILKELNSLDAAPEITNGLFHRAEEMGLEVFVAEPGKAMYDDHIPLLMAGVKTVDLIDTNYPYWHTLSDTPDKCSHDTLRQIGALLVDFLYDFPF